MTPLGWLNFLVLQWCFIRLARVYGDEPAEDGWAILGPVLPLTGWWSDYIGIVRWLQITRRR